MSVAQIMVELVPTVMSENTGRFDEMAFRITKISRNYAVRRVTQMSVATAYRYYRLALQRYQASDMSLPMQHYFWIVMGGALTMTREETEILMSFMVDVLELL
jgi:mannose-6-phosphate isomerase-like protein (cupin superfamily)